MLDTMLGWAAAALQDDADFTITAGVSANGVWYSRRGDDVIGSATGRLRFSGRLVRRVFTDTNDDLVINISGGLFSTWRSEHLGFRIVFTFLDGGFAQSEFTNVQFKTVGTQFLRLRAVTGWAAQVAAVTIGDHIRVQISEGR